MQKINSIFLAQDFPPIPGGVSVYTDNLVRNWSGPAFVLVPQANDAKDDRYPRNIIVRRIKMNLKRGKVLFIIKRQVVLLKACFKIIRSQKVQLIQCMHLASGATALILKIIFGIPYVLYTYGSEITAPSTFFSRKITEIIIRNALYIVTMSGFTKNAITAYGVDENKIRYLVGVEIEQFLRNGSKRLTKVAYNIKGKPILLTVARLMPHKGIDTVIMALPAILKHYPDVSYVVVGEGPYRGVLETLINTLNLEKNVYLLGNTPHDEMQNDDKAFYSICDLYVMISRNIKGIEAEGFGLVFLEAGLSGKAVIGGRSGGIEDAVLDNITGKLVDPDKPNDVANCIVSLLEVPHILKEMGENGYKRALGEFNWITNVCRWEEQINRIVKAQGH